MKVQTIHGLVERDALEARDEVTENECARITVTQWFMGGECVRRDVNVNMLRGIETGADLGR